MARRRYYRRDNELERIFSIFLTLALLGLVGYVYKNPTKFLAYLLFFVVCFAIFIFLWNWSKKRHFTKVLARLRNSGQEENLKNFINRFGLEGKEGKGYSFRNHNFDWDRINDLKKILRESNVISNDKDVFRLLRFYIQEKEENLTRGSIQKQPQKFSDLTGVDFEKLLYRLFSTMSYQVQWIGKSGDQGGDLIANKPGDRILIQAKAYRDWSTGNEAVQQVVGAMKHYDCNKTMVVTTSHFTPAAITLAKDNNTELISKERLQELLLEFLGESWI